MEIIYLDNVLKHNKNDFLAEGSYRLDGIENFAKKVQVKKNILSFIFKVHTKDYFEMIKLYCKSKKNLAEVNLTPESLDAIKDSVKLSIFASENNCFAITRPPGHHAEKEFAKGFCFLNNIAIATQYLLDKGKKVCIIDFDSHPGDGTQTIFYKDKRVLFCSIHQENSYPFTKGTIYEIGESDARGFNINIPLSIDSGDDVLLKAIKFLRKYILDFNPDVIAVSAGFDGYYKDNLLSLKYTENGYYFLGREISEFKKPVFAVLEGGYHKDVLNCINSFVNGINNSEITEQQRTISNSPDYCLKNFEKTTDKLVNLLSPYFKLK